MPRLPKQNPHVRIDDPLANSSLPGLTNTEVSILDALAAGPLSDEALYSHVGPSLWGRHIVISAVNAGLLGDEQSLALRGKRIAFDNAIKSLRRKGGIILDADNLWAWTGKRLERMHEGKRERYVPGTEASRTDRWIRTQRIDVILARHGGLNALFGDMQRDQLAALAESIRLEGYDTTKPVIRDADTGLTIDGRQREKAAEIAGVVPNVETRKFANDLERLRFAIQTNLLRRHLTAAQQKRLAAILTDELNLSTREAAEWKGTSRMTVGQPRPSAKATDEVQGNAGTFNNARTVGTPQLRGGSRELWGTIERRQQAEDDALLWREVEGRAPTEIAYALVEKYGLRKPLANGTVWSLVRNARWRRDGAPGRHQVRGSASAVADTVFDSAAETHDLEQAATIVVGVLPVPAQVDLKRLLSTPRGVLMLIEALAD